MRLFLMMMCLLAFNISFSQDTVFFKDGTSKKGKVTLMSKAVLKFKAEGSRKAKKYTDSKVERAIVNRDGKDIEYTVVKVPKYGFGKVFLGKVLTGEHIDLYLSHQYVASSPASKTGISIRAKSGVRDFYLSKKAGEKEYFQLNVNGALVNKFKNRASKYFSDCPKLSAKIKTKRLGEGDVEEICEYYNAKCN